MADIVFNPSSGSKDTTVNVSSVTNEGIDTSTEYQVSTNDGSVTRKVTVNQTGKRETFNVLTEDGTSHEEFLLSDGGTFNVLKEEYANG